MSQWSSGVKLRHLNIQPNGCVIAHRYDETTFRLKAIASCKSIKSCYKICLVLLFNFYVGRLRSNRGNVSHDNLFSTLLILFSFNQSSRNEARTCLYWSITILLIKSFIWLLFRLKKSVYGRQFCLAFNVLVLRNFLSNLYRYSSLAADKTKALFLMLTLSQNYSQNNYGMAHFVSTEKPSMAPTHKHPVKKRELHLKHIQILIMS